MSERATLARILVVEDEFLIALTVEDILKVAGYEVVGPASTYEEALSLAGRLAPDLVLMDVRLASQRDGIDAALEIRRRNDIPCLFASANLDPQNRARAAPARAAGWLPKPYTPEVLVKAVAEALSAVAGGRDLESEASATPGGEKHAMTRLSGIRILVVEDEALVAAMVADMLEEDGAEVVGPVGRLADAVELARTAPLDLALLDVNLRGEQVHPVAEALEARGIPFVFASGQNSAPDARWEAVPIVDKPYSTETLTQAIVAVLSSRG